MNDKEIKKFFLYFIKDKKIGQDFAEAVNELQDDLDSNGGNIAPPEIVPPRFEL